MEKLPLAKLFHRVQRMSKFTKTSIEVTRGAQENVLTPLFFPAPISYRKKLRKESQSYPELVRVLMRSTLDIKTFQVVRDITRELS